MDSDDPVVNELKLMREQQWSMHRSLVERIEASVSGLGDRLDARIDGTNARLDQTNARLDQTNARLDQTNAHLAALSRYTVDGFEKVNARVEATNDNIEALARYTVEGFEQVVARQNTLQTAFERFVELSLGERPTTRS